MKVSEWEGCCAHEKEHPAGYGAYICSGDACALALEATLRQYPDTKLVIKLGGPRRVITAQEYLEVFHSEPDPASRVMELCGRHSINGREDYIREVFVMEGTGAPMEDDD